MPYTIHIPSPYQAHHHMLLTRHTTTISSIDISTASALSLSIYNDAKAWGWNVEYTPIDTYGAARWDVYRKTARENGWYDDLWYIWQREHGIRIRAKDQLLHPVAPSPMKIAFRELRGFASWIKRARAYAIGRTEEKPGLWRRNVQKPLLLGRTVSGSSRVRAATYDQPRSRLRRTSSEGNLERVDASATSLASSLVERLGGLDVDRKVSVAHVVDSEVEGQDEDADMAKSKSNGPASESPFSDKYVLLTEQDEWHKG